MFITKKNLPFHNLEDAEEYILTCHTPHDNKIYHSLYKVESKDGYFYMQHFMHVMEYVFNDLLYDNATMCKTTDEFAMYFNFGVKYKTENDYFIITKHNSDILFEENEENRIK